MDFESLVLYYLSAQGIFLAPQFSIRSEHGEWSCPDFVALDFAKKQIQVVEVTVAYSVDTLIEKVRQRELQWFNHLKPQLLELKIPVSDWACTVRLFIRRDRLDHVRAKFAGQDDVTVEAIEDISFAWMWPWDKWRKELASQAQS